jgi:hypothetical protein
MARLIDVIEVPNQQEDELIRRIPETGTGDFRFGSQLIVRELQQAVFFRDGKAYDVFGPGRHTITTANVSSLSSLIGMATSGRTPFTAEVYFVNMRKYLDEKWGTPSPIVVGNPITGATALRIWGTYAWSVGDPKRLLEHIVAPSNISLSALARILHDVLLRVVTKFLTNLYRTGDKPVWEIFASQFEIEAAIRIIAREDFDDMGLALQGFHVQGIDPVEMTPEQRRVMGLAATTPAPTPAKPISVFPEEPGTEAEAYDIAAIRSLLRDAFTSRELWRLIQGCPALRPLLSRITYDDNLEKMIDVLTEFCRTQTLFSKLLSEVRQSNPKQFERYAQQLNGWETDILGENSVLDA